MNNAHGGLEEIAGVHIAVLQVLIGGTVELVRPGLQNDVGDRTGAASQIHRVVAGGDVHRADGLQRRDQDLQQAGTLVVVDPFNLVVVDHARSAVDFGLQGVGSVKELGV